MYVCSILQYFFFFLTTSVDVVKHIGVPVSKWSGASDQNVFHFNGNYCCSNICGGLSHTSFTPKACEKKRRNDCADRGKFGFLYIYKPDGRMKQRLCPGSVWKCHRKGFLERGWTFEFIVELFLLLLLPVGCIMNERFLRRTSADAIDQKENEEHCRKWDVESDEMDESHRGSHTNSAQARVGSKQ